MNRSSMRAVAVVVTVVVAGYLFSEARGARAPVRAIRTSGTVEAYETKLSTLLPGRVLECRLSEGAPVQKGQTVIQLDTGAFDKTITDIDEAERMIDSQSTELCHAINRLEETLGRGSALPQSRRSLSSTRSAPNTIPSLASLGALKQAPQGDLQMPDIASKLLTEQSKELVKQQKRQLEATNHCFDTQEEGLREAAAKEKQTVTQAHEALSECLKEGTKAAMPGNHIWDKIWPLSSLKKAKKKAVCEIASAKQQTVDVKYCASIDEIDEVSKAKSEALRQGRATALKSINEAFQSKAESLQATKQMLQAGNSLQARITKSAIASQLSALGGAVPKNGGNLLSAAGGSGAIGNAMEMMQSSGTAAIFAAKQSQTGLALLQLADLKSKLAALELERLKLRQSQDEAKSKQDQMVIKAPMSGVCETKNIQTGEAALPGQTLATIYNPHNMYLRTFVAEKDIGLVQVGQSARVYFDAAPKNPVDAEVSEIDSRASFTPENVATPEGRSAQVFGVKLKLHGSSTIAKPGLPADAEILVGFETSR